MIPCVDVQNTASASATASALAPAAAPAPAPMTFSSAADIEPLTQQEAVSLAKTWYDEQGPFVGTFAMAIPVSACHFNYVGARDCECSIRYGVRPDTGESYFVRFSYEVPSGTLQVKCWINHCSKSEVASGVPGTEAWRAVGMDMARASELPDSDSENLARSWRALVTLCARALGRSESNLGKAYTSEVSISRQLAALGTSRSAV